MLQQLQPSLGCHSLARPFHQVFQKLRLHLNVVEEVVVKHWGVLRLLDSSWPRLYCPLLCHLKGLALSWVRHPLRHLAHLECLATCCCRRGFAAPCYPSAPAPSSHCCCHRNQFWEALIQLFASPTRLCCPQQHFSDSATCLLFLQLLRSYVVN